MGPKTALGGFQEGLARDGYQVASELVVANTPTALAPNVAIIRTNKDSQWCFLVISAHLKNEIQTSRGCLTLKIRDLQKKAFDLLIPHCMIANWPLSPVLMFLSFPILCTLLMIYVRGTVEFAPRTIRAHRVSYRPIQTRLADWILILRLAFARD
ncbi:MAG: hypothetical protein WDN28_17440 [Chthoniobacter sp.]